MPFTSYGLREILIGIGVFLFLGLLCILFAKAYGMPGLYWFFVPLVILLGWVLWFFRDPPRTVPAGPGLIVSPADGVVTHIDVAEEADFIGGAALRCSIFLSIFDVHLNRAPVAGEVVYLKAREGAFHDARSESSLDKNQNQDLGLEPSEPGMPAKILVRQSTGAIARRIVCPVAVGRKLERGGIYGMIKFGSRTTLFLPEGAGVEWLVKIGDKVKAGETALARMAVRPSEGPRCP